MMLADADEIDARLIGQHRLVDQIADYLRRMQRLAVRAVGDIAERVETEFDGHWLAPLMPERAQYANSLRSV